MCLLDDKTLVEMQSSSPLVKNLQVPTNPADWFSQDSAIQASSMDLHIGKIFLPGKTGKAEGSADCPLELYSLEPGQTAIVTTCEELSLSSDIAGIGFPPSHVSLQGLLMTNPGHVDPGYSGLMRFTVINMGKEDYVLRAKDAIVTVLFVKLVQAAQKDWQQRGGRRGGLPTQTDLDRLSADFVNVKARAEKIAENAIKAENFKLKRFEVSAGLISAVILAFLYWFSGLQDLKTKVAELERSLNVVKMQQQIDSLELKIKPAVQSGTSGPLQPAPQRKSSTTK